MEPKSIRLARITRARRAAAEALEMHKKSYELAHRFDKYADAIAKNRKDHTVGTVEYASDDPNEKQIVIRDANGKIHYTIHADTFEILRGDA